MGSEQDTSGREADHAVMLLLNAILLGMMADIAHGPSKVQSGFLHRKRPQAIVDHRVLIPEIIQCLRNRRALAGITPKHKGTTGTDSTAPWIERLLPGACVVTHAQWHCVMSLSALSKLAPQTL